MSDKTVRARARHRFEARSSVVSQKDAPRVHVETIEQWREWLAEHHLTETSVWLVTWRKKTGRPAPPYENQIEEALRVGWVDSTAKKLDDERSMLYFARRRRGSEWARTNKNRIARLEAEGAMLPAGQAVVDQGSRRRLVDRARQRRGSHRPGRPGRRTRPGSRCTGSLGRLHAVGPQADPLVDRAGQTALDPRRAGRANRSPGITRRTSAVAGPSATFPSVQVVFVSGGGEGGTL